MTIVLAVVAMTLTTISPVFAHESTYSERGGRVSWAEFEQELSFSDAPGPDLRGTDNGAGRTNVLGWTRLVRTAEGIEATALILGLKPGGVYTFWWTSPNDFDNEGNPIIPSGLFAASGAATVIGQSGMAFVRMSAEVGQKSIVGLPALDDALFSELKDPLTAIIRIEVAYHGQAEDADGDLETWMSDFWTGTACPEAGGLNFGGQPFCPVYLAATHTVQNQAVAMNFS